MDPEVRSLVRAERLLEAARLASERGQSRDASTLYERACDWANAAREALRSGDRLRAMELAAQSDDDALSEGVVTLLENSRPEALAAAERLSLRGLDRWAARLLEAGGEPKRAARAWERAGLPKRAAELLERAGDPRAAAKTLEAAVRREPDAFSTVVALGSLLTRFGKYEAAVRALQRVPQGAPERRSALVDLVSALTRLGLSRSAADAAAELEACGGPVSGRETPAPPAPPTCARLFGRYEVVREASSSASARVLECIDVVRGDTVAVKLFAAWDARGTGRDALSRFEREVRTMKALDHPNVVPLREFVPEGPAIILSWMAGGTLERLLVTAGRLAPARAVEIATSLLTALGEAHRLGIVHRDVKPSNVLFDEAGGARLSDFGVAHLGDASTTATAGIFGTLAYMSPEQRQGRPATARSDLFAVGVMLREMLTGERPTAADASRAPPSSAHADLDLRHDAVVARLTAPNPGERPDDAFEARSALLGLPWSQAVDATVVGPSASRKPSVWPPAARLVAGAGEGLPVDTWMGRAIEHVPLSDARLLRAQAFARAGHPALQSVLRVDRDDGALWLEGLDAPSAAPLLEQALSAPERAEVTAALEALHAAGGVHGRVDAAHIVLMRDRVVVRLNLETDATATADRDWLALARL